MVFLVSIIAGAYGAHVMWSFLTGGEIQVWRSGLFGTLGGGLAAALLYISDPLLIDRLNTALGAFNMGLAVAYFLCGLLGGAIVCLLFVLTSRNTAQQ